MQQKEEEDELGNNQAKLMGNKVLENIPNNFMNPELNILPPNIQISDSQINQVQGQKVGYLQQNTENISGAPHFQA